MKKILLLVLLGCINSKAIESCEYSIMTATGSYSVYFSVVVDPIRGDYLFDNLFKLVSTNDYILDKFIPGSFHYTEVDPLGYINVGDNYRAYNLGSNGFIYEYGISRVSTNNLEITSEGFHSLCSTMYFDFNSITNLNGITDFTTSNRASTSNRIYHGNYSSANIGYMWCKLASSILSFMHVNPTIANVTNIEQLPKYWVNPMFPLYMYKSTASSSGLTTKSNIWISVSNKIIE